MTRDEKLAQADPGWVKGRRRERWIVGIFGVLALVALIFGAVSFAVNFKQGDDIARIESPCQKYGSDSEQCEEAFSLAVSTITHPQACAIERKAGTLRAIRELAEELGVEFTEPCAGARIEQERVRSNERARTRIRAEAAAGDRPGRSAGAQRPSSDDGGHEQVGGRGGGSAPADRSDEKKPPAPSSGNSAPAPVPPSPATEEEEETRPSPPPTADEEGESDGGPAVKGPVQQTTDAALEAAGELVEDVAAAADGAVCGTLAAPDCQR